MTPQIYASNSDQGANLLENEYQDFSFGTATTWTVSPGLPVLGTGVFNPSSQGGIRYVSTVPIYVMVQRTGTLNSNQTMLDAAGWVSYSFDASGYANFTLPAGAHTFQWKTNFATAGSLKIVQFWTDRGGEIVWQLWPTIGDDPSTGWNEAASDIGDGHWWTFTATHRFLYIAGGSGNCWIHTILPFEGAVETPGIMRSVNEGTGEQGNKGTGTDDGNAGPEGPSGGRALNDDFNATTQAFSLAGYSSAELSFYQKYALQVGANGVVVLVGNDTAGDGIYKFRYVTPKRPYTGNIRFDIPATRISDDYGREMRWCFNGISTNGLGLWDYITVDLTPFIGQTHVKVRFLYINATMTNVGYWYVDDIVVRASRGDSTPSANAVDDQWELVTKSASLSGGDTADAYSGAHAWLCHDPSPGVDYLKGGIDNSLTTVPIDLTNALDAALDVMFKFNINATDGRPPDGLRIEVSSDNGETWQSLNRGARSGSGVSGTVAAGADGTSVTGVDVGGSWVASATMSRLSCDLSGWAGHVILIRFRVVTRTDIATHYESNAAGFGGVYVDDVKVTGNTTTGGRSVGERSVPQGTGGDGHSGAAQTSDINKDGVDSTMYKNDYSGNGKEDNGACVWTSPSVPVRPESATATSTARFETAGGGKR
jgi:hypothetical protein